jgi:hypothetical protein
MQTSSNNNGSGGVTLVEQVQARKEQLERALTADTTSASTRADIEAALASIVPMLTGDLAKLPDMVSRELTRWLETNKYIGAQGGEPDADAAAADATPAPTPTATGPVLAKVDDDGEPAPAAAPGPSTPARRN